MISIYILMFDHKLFNPIKKEIIMHYIMEESRVVKFKIKVQKNGKVIEKVISMNQSSIFYFVDRLAEYGWKRI